MARPSVLAECLRRCRTSLLAVFVFSFFLNLLSFAFPLYLLQIYDRVMPSRSADSLLVLTLIVLVAVIALAMLDTLRNSMLVHLAAWIDRCVGGEVLAAEIVAAKQRGRPKSSRAIRHLAAVRDFIGGPHIVPLFDIPWTPLFLLVLFLMHPWLGAIALTGVVLLFGISMLNDWFSKRAVADATDTGSAAADAADEASRNADVIEAMGMRDQVVQRWVQFRSSATEAELGVATRAILFGSLSKLVKLVLLVATLATAAYLIVTNSLSAGGVIAAMLLFRRSIGPWQRAVGSWNSFIKARRGMRKLEEHLGQLDVAGNREPVFDHARGLVLEGVRVEVPGRRDPLLSEVTLSVNPGEAVALLGPTASGKTTLARMMAGNVAPGAGEVSLGGVSLSAADRAAVGPLIGYLPQTVDLFSGTIAENIARLTAAPLDAVITAAKLAGVNRMIRAMPEQFETRIGEGGARLSGGQRQRIGLARAVFGEPVLVILDEPDANLDARGRRAVTRAIRELKKRNAMVVLITHQSGVLQDIDRTYELKEGRLELLESAAVSSPQPEPRPDASPVIQLRPGNPNAGR